MTRLGADTIVENFQFISVLFIFSYSIWEVTSDTYPKFNEIQLRQQTTISLHSWQD